MAKALKYWYEWKDYEGTLFKEEIWVEGFVGTVEELKAGSEPLIKSYNKDVGEKYLGGIVPFVANLSAKSSSAFKATAFSGENYGDAILKHKQGSTVLFNAVIVPFEGMDEDLDDGFYKVQLSAECGLNYLKSIPFVPTSTRKTLLNIIDVCITNLPYIDSFGYYVVENTTTNDGSATSLNYFDTFIDDRQFTDMNCYDVIKAIIQEYGQFVFADGRWNIFNIANISLENSTYRIYDASVALTSSGTYTRPTKTIRRLAGGQFGRMFSQQSVKIEKKASPKRALNANSDFTTDTDWTYVNLASILFEITGGKLSNKGNTYFTYEGATADTSYVQSPASVFYPFKSIFDLSEKQVLKISLKSSKGAYLKNLRLQILASQNNVLGSGQHVFYLTNEKTWYRAETGINTPFYYQEFEADKEKVIEIPQLPYLSGSYSPLLPNIIPDFGEFIPYPYGQPATNVPFYIYVRVFMPERTFNTYSGIATTTADFTALIDYININVNDIGSEITDGFVKKYGLEEKKDRDLNFTVKLGVGYPSYPIGYDALFRNDSTTTQISLFNGVSIEEHIANSYLSVLGARQKFYSGTVQGDLEFSDLVSIDSVKYRIHNLTQNFRTRQHTIKAISLTVGADTVETLPITPFDIVIDQESLQRSITEELKKKYGDTLGMKFVDKNFEVGILADGQKSLKLREDLRIDKLYTSEAYLRTALDGSIKDVATNTAGNYILTKPARTGTYALLDDFDTLSWLLNGNALASSKKLGSTTNQDWTIVHSNATVATVKAASVDYVVDINTTGNVTLQKGNPRIRLRDTGAGGHTGGFDFHVNGDEFIIDDNTHSRNILRNYLNSSVHTTDFDAEVFGFKNGGTTFATVNSSGLTLGTISAESTDVDKFLVSNAGLVKFRTGTQLLSDIGAFASPTGLTTNTIPKWNGSAFANSQIFDNGTNVGIGTAIPISKLDVNISARTTTYSAANQTTWSDVHIWNPTAALSASTGIAFQMGTDYNNNAAGGIAVVKSGAASDNGADMVFITRPQSAVSAERMRITLDGNVAIGTTTANDKLSIGNNSSIGLNATSSSHTTRLNWRYDGITYAWIERVNADGAMAFGVQSSERARIDGSGNFGIGTVNPTYKLDVTGTGHFTGAVTFDSVPSSLQDATSSNHLVRYSQWIASALIKYLPTAVKTVALTNITLSGTQTINGVALVATDRVLLIGQTTASQNGIYDVSASGWTRATDSDADSEIRGYIVSVSNGTYAGYKYINTNTSAITVGSTSITYSEFSNTVESDPIFTTWRDTSRTANTFFAAPNGSSGAATFRAIVAADIPTLNQSTTGSAATLTTEREIAITGDATWSVSFNGSAGVTSAITLATVNSNVGTWNNVTVNGKGLVTAGSNVSYLTANQTTTFTGDATGSGTTAVTLTLATVATAGTYRSVTVNAKGLVTAGTNPTTISGYGITDYDSLWDTRLATKTTSNLTEGSNLYYTNARGIGSVLTGYTSGAGTVSATDTILQAIQKLNGNIGAFSGTYINLTTNVTGILPIANGGTGSTTQNFVDLATTQTSIGGTKTFTATLNALNLYSTGGIINSGGSSGLTLNSGTLGATVSGYTNYTSAQSGTSIYYDYRPYIHIAHSFIYRRGYMKLTGANTGNPASDDLTAPTERLHVDGNIRYSGTLKPANATPSIGQFLKADSTSTNTWATITTSDISNLSSYTGFDARYFTETESDARFQPLDADLTAIAALAGTSGFLKKTAANTWSLDTATYLSANQTITLSGIVTGSGTTSITTAIADSALSIAKTSGLQTALDAKMPLVTGTIGQVFAYDGSNYNFMNLDHKPLKLNINEIAVGNDFGLLESRSEFTYNRGILKISNKTDATKYVNFGMISPTGTDALVQVLGGGNLNLLATNVYLNSLGGSAIDERALVVDRNGKISAKVISGGGVVTTPTLTQYQIGIGNSVNQLDGSPNFVYNNGSLVLTNTASSNTNVIRINGSDGYDKNIFFAEVGLTDNGGFFGYRAGVNGNNDPTMLVMQTVDDGVIMGGISIHRQNGHVYIGANPNSKLYSSTELATNKLFVDGNARIGGSTITLSGTVFKLSLSDAISGASPANGDKYILTFDSSKSAFVLQKINTYSNGGRTYLIL